jgi:hypothetical protein
MKKHFFSLIVPYLLISFLNASSKIHPSQIVGGPLQRLTPYSTSVSKPDRERHVPYKYKHQRGVPLAQMYKGSSHESALDAQISAYKSKALKNLLVFGGYTKRWLSKNDFKRMVSDMTSPRNLKEEFIKLEKRGDIKILFKDGDEFFMKIDLYE